MIALALPGNQLAPYPPRRHKEERMDFFTTHVSENAIREVEACLRAGRLSEGVRVKALEDTLHAQLGLAEPVCVNSGTTALHLALIVAGVQDGDEVILPAQTFIATALAILMQRAVPVFADIDPETGNLDPLDVARRVTEKTRAIIPVHWAGLPCNMAELNAIARKHDLAMIEDAAHALGATYQGQPVGNLSRFTCFSFQAIKHLTTGDGGAIACQNPDDAQKAKKLRWFGIDRARSPVTELGERDYDLTELGYKYHLCDFAAALAIGNLPDIPGILAKRRETAAIFDAALRQIPGVQLLRRDADRQSAHWVYTLRVQKRLDFVRALKSRGVPTSVVHNRIDHNTLFGGLRDDLPGQTLFDAEQIALPVHEDLTPQDIRTVVEAVQAGW